MGILSESAWAQENMILGTDQHVYDMLDTLECPEHLVELELYDEDVYEALCEAHYTPYFFPIKLAPADRIQRPTC